MSIVLVATMSPNDDDRAEVLSLLEETIARVHIEDAGCELYSLHRDGNDFIFIEKWTDQASLDAHRVSDAMRALSPRLAGRLKEKPTVRFLSPHPAGTPELGVL